MDFFNPNELDNYLKEVENYKPDYNTNAESYYKALARHKNFMKLFTAKIIQLNNELKEEFKDHKDFTQETIDEFQRRVDGIKQEMTDFFNQWLADGVLDEVINQDILNQKADKIELNQNTGFNILNVETTSTDWTVIIQTALDTYNHVIIPKGVYTILGTIELKRNQVLELMGETTLLKPITCENDEPVIWIKDNYALLKGTNKKTSMVKSERPSPNGVVSLGYKNMDDLVGKNILYCTITTLSISGGFAGGVETGNPSIGLYLCNPQINNLASYFHSINHLYIENANIGILLEGYANANIIDDIQLYRIGNQKWLKGGGIVFKNSVDKGPLDNMVSNVFHHASTNADTLVFIGFCHYNTLNNIVGEPGGATARWLVEYPIDGQNTSNGNIISGIDNVAGGTFYTELFRKVNNITARVITRTGSIESDTLKSNVSMTTDIVNAKQIIMNSKELTEKTKNGLSENTTTPFLRIQVPFRTSGIVEIDMGTDGSVNSFIHSGSIKIAVKRGSTGNVTVTDIYNTTSLVDMLSYTINVDTIEFNLKTGTNGTTANNLSCLYNLMTSGTLKQKATITHL